VAGSACTVGGFLSMCRNTAVVCLSWLIVTSHVSFWPAQAPSQPLNEEPLSASATSWRSWPSVGVATHFGPQSTPAPPPTYPCPRPAFKTVSLTVGGGGGGPGCGISGGSPG